MGIQPTKLDRIDSVPIELAIIRVFCGAISCVVDSNNMYCTWTSKYRAPISDSLVSK